MGLFATTTSLETLMVGTNFSGLTALASRCCTDAENECRKILSRRYDMSDAAFNTTTSIPPMVSTIATWYAMGLLYEANARGGKESYQRADRYLDKAKENLEEIIEGDADLVDSSGALISEGDSKIQILSSTDGYSTTFDQDDPESWAVDSDKLDDIADGRD